MMVEFLNLLLGSVNTISMTKVVWYSKDIIIRILSLYDEKPESLGLGVNVQINDMIGLLSKAVELRYLIMSWCGVL